MLSAGDGSVAAAVAASLSIHTLSLSPSSSPPLRCRSHLVYSLGPLFPSSLFVRTALRAVVPAPSQDCVGATPRKAVVFPSTTHKSMCYENAQGHFLSSALPPFAGKEAGKEGCPPRVSAKNVRCSTAPWRAESRSTPLSAAAATDLARSLPSACVPPPFPFFLLCLTHQLSIFQTRSTSAHRVHRIDLQHDLFLSLSFA